VNHFHAAGGTGCLFRALLNQGLMHADAQVVWGASFADYTQEPCEREGALSWQQAPSTSLDETVLRGGDKPFSVEGGLKLLTGNLGRSVIKTSAVAPDRRVITAPAVVIEHQDELDALFAAGELNHDCVVVVRGQGPKANGMPELHKLTPFLGALQDQGYRVALVTDGRMSGASGKVPAAIHLTPEALDGGLIGRIQTGDMICLDSDAGELTLQVDAGECANRADWHPSKNLASTCGRQLFTLNRAQLNCAEAGATYLFEAV
jgi:phosphogluconate dehydratase